MGEGYWMARRRRGRVKPAGERPKGRAAARPLGACGGPSAHPPAPPPRWSEEDEQRRQATLREEDRLRDELERQEAESPLPEPGATLLKLYRRVSLWATEIAQIEGW